MAAQADNDERISQAELGRRLGITPPAVTKLKKAGKIVVGRDGKVRYRATLKKLGDTLDPRKPKKTLHAVKDVVGEDDPVEDDGESHVSLAEAQRRKAVAAAVIAELDLEEKKGSLIGREAAERRVFEFVRGFRDSILNFPTRYAAVIAADLGVQASKVQTALDKRLKDYIGELADRQLRL